MPTAMLHCGIEGLDSRPAAAFRQIGTIRQVELPDRLFVQPASARRPGLLSSEWRVIRPELADHNGSSAGGRRCTLAESGKRRSSLADDELDSSELAHFS